MCTKTRRGKNTIFAKGNVSCIGERYGTHGLLNKTVTLLRSSEESSEGSLRRCSQLPALVLVAACIMTALGNQATVLAKTLA